MAEGWKTIFARPYLIAVAGVIAVALTLACALISDTWTIIGAASGSVIGAGIVAWRARGIGPQACALLMVIVAVSLLGGITLAEEISGQTLHGLVTHQPDHGTTLGRHTESPATRTTPTYQYQPSRGPSEFWQPPPSRVMTPAPLKPRASASTSPATAAPSSSPASSPATRPSSSSPAPTPSAPASSPAPTHTPTFVPTPSPDPPTGSPSTQTSPGPSPASSPSLQSS